MDSCETTTGHRGNDCQSGSSVFCLLSQRAFIKSGLQVFLQSSNSLPLLANANEQGPSSQSYGFSSSHVWMWELDYRESWAPKNRCFGTVVLEKTLESPLDCKEIQPVNPKGYQSWMFIEGLMLKLKLQYFGHLMWRANSFEKKPDAGREWRQEEKGTTEDEMVGWHYWLNGHEFEQTFGDGDGQGSLMNCSP